MRIKILKITATIFFTLLMTIYSTFTLASILMLYIISFPYSGEEINVVNNIIDYAMFSVILLVSLICTISGLLYLYKKNINLIFILPLYLFLPLSLPYLLIQLKIKNNREIYEIDDSLFSMFLLTVTSLINYLFALVMLVLGVTLLEVAFWVPLTLFFSIPLLIIGICIFAGTTANIVSCRHKDLIADRIAYIGLTFVWIYKVYKASLVKNNLYSIRAPKSERKRKIKVA